jgi:hypothetical protein
VEDEAAKARIPEARGVVRSRADHSLFIAFRSLTSLLGALADELNNL